MFGVGGSAAVLRVLSPRLAQQAITKLPQRALTRTIYYPLIKRIAASIGFKMNKKLFAQGVGKIIPIVGGVISGSFTLIALKQMGGRLQKELALSINYTTVQQKNDLKEIQKIIDLDPSTESTIASATQEAPYELSYEEFLTQQSNIQQMYKTGTISLQQYMSIIEQLKRSYEHGNR